MYNSCKNDNSPEVGVIMPKHLVNMRARKYAQIYLCVMRLRTSSLVLIINFDLFLTHLLVLTVNEVVG